MPLISILTSWVILKEKGTFMEVLGALVGFSGVLVFSIPLLSGLLLLGSTLTLLNAMFWSLYSVYFRKLKENDPVSVVASQFLLGSLIMMVFSPVGFKLIFTGRFVIDLLYLAVFGGAAQFLLWDLMMREDRIDVTTTSVFAVPALTMVLQSIETMKLPSALSITGVALMFAGIYTSARSKTSKKS
jgi:drug/metabolite transporter (DMT)-like permease